MKRSFDFISAVVLLIILFPVLLIIGVLVKTTSRGPAIHWSKRIGQNNKVFLMPKFRTMKMGTPQLATHLLNNANNHLTPIGSFLRKSSLDELPQLLSVIKGDMSFVGPRPALFNQDDLMELRTKFGVEKLRPGITGWAQINGRDDLEIPAKVDLDVYYFQNASFALDLKILFQTFFKVVRNDGIKH